MRAAVEHHNEAIEVPPLNIIICKGKEDLTIKVGHVCSLQTEDTVMFC